MNDKVKLLLIPALLMLTAGCSSVSEPQKAPVTGRPLPPKTQPNAKAPKKVPPGPVAKPAPSVPGTATYAIEPPKSDFKVEPTLPAFRVDPLKPPVETPVPMPAAPVAPAVPGQLPGVSTNQLAPAVGAAPPLANTGNGEMLTTATAASLPAYVPEDVRPPKNASPAVLALLTDSDRSRATGDLDAAVISMERALRIDSRNATLTYKLAQLRIKQNKPQLAEELAGKAALLAGSDLELKRKSWLLIAEARRLQQNLAGAKEAKSKAESFFGR